MTEGATITAPANNTRGTASLGSFDLVERLTDIQKRLGGLAAFAATRKTGTSIAGMPAFAYCVALPEGNTAIATRVAAQLATAGELDFDSIVPAYESGIAGRVAYVIEQAPDGERLSQWQERNRKPTPWIVSGIIGDIASALQVAHDAGTSHGMVVPAIAWVDHEGRTRLGGFGLAGRGSDFDQMQLSALAIELLSGKVFDLDATKGMALPMVTERIRDHVNGLTERVATMLARGLSDNPAIRLNSVAEFAIGLRTEIVVAGSDVAAGAWEAISHRDAGMASMLVEKVAEYDPASPELPLLRVRLNEDVMLHPNFATAMFVENKAMEDSAVDLDPMAATLKFSPEANESEEYRAAVRALLTPPTPAQLDKPKANPMYILVIGVCVMIVILTVLTALTFTGV